MISNIGVRGYHYVEFYTGSAKMWAYWFCKAFSMQVTGYAGPETGVKDRVSYLLTLNNLKFIITSATKPSTYDVYGFIEKHGDGVKRWSLEVDDVTAAYHYAVEHFAIPVRSPRKIEDELGYVEEAAIKLYDDAEIVFFNKDNYSGIIKPGFRAPVNKITIETNPTNLQQVDHIVGNVRINEMNMWANYLNNALALETFIEFGPGDISTKYSALLSKVVRSPDKKIRNPINEPFEGMKKSQIEEYIDEYLGSGIQHVAITTENIIETIGNLRRNGVEFLPHPPDTYYEMLKEKGWEVTEDIGELKKHGILCDLEGTGYLLQLFTKPIGDRPTFFFEIIQRCKGAEGFGRGNFQALFESIERDQVLRGNFDRE